MKRDELLSVLRSAIHNDQDTTDIMALIDVYSAQFGYSSDQMREYAVKVYFNVINGNHSVKEENGRFIVIKNNSAMIDCLPFSPDLQHKYDELKEILEKDERKRLFDFFLWFRENGENHIDKSIEKMIEIYMTEKAVL